MGNDRTAIVAAIAASARDAILAEWLGLLKNTGILRTGRITEAELRTECRDFIDLLGQVGSPSGYDRLQEMLGKLSRSRASQGFSPTETATFVFSLKQAMFETMNKGSGSPDDRTTRDTWQVNLFFDEIGLYTMELYQKSREEVIIRQQREISELSTPVVKLWDGILALPIIGTLDSQRTQVVMENLLQSIVDENAEIAIVDITGVPTVDTLTAQHLLKTVAAARLMGADCIISGIRPQIAQTMVHLGVELNVLTKATLADAFSIALRRIGRTIVASTARTRPADTAGQA